MEGSVHSISRGVAIGVFIGISPTLPLHTVAILILSPLFKANLIAAIIAATVVSNPLTFFFQYYFSWMIGSWLFPCDVSWQTIESMLAMFREAGFMESMRAFSHLGCQTLTTLILGGVVLATPFTIVAYFLSLRLVRAFRETRRKKHILL